MNNNWLWGLLIMTALLLTGCSGAKTGAASSETPSNPNSVTNLGNEPLIVKTVQVLAEGQKVLTEEQNGSSVALTINETLQIVIGGNPTTGYVWEAENLDAILLEQQGEPAFIPTSDLKGAGGNYVFTFKALKAGETHLRLIYHRTFEKNVPPARVYEVTVDIRE